MAWPTLLDELISACMQQQLHEVIQNILDEPIPERVKKQLLKLLKQSQGGNQLIAPLR